MIEQTSPSSSLLSMSTWWFSLFDLSALCASPWGARIYVSVCSRTTQTHWRLHQPWRHGCSWHWRFSRETSPSKLGFNFWVWGMEHSWLCLCYFKESLGFPSNLFLGLANFWPWHPHCIINWLLIVTQLDDAMQHFFPKLTFCKRDLAQTQI